MTSKALQIGFVIAILIGGVIASLFIHNRAQFKLRQNSAMLQQNENQLAELAAENRRLASLDSQPRHSSAENRTAEIVKLHTEAEALRKQLAGNHQQHASLNSPSPDSGRTTEGTPTEELVRIAASRNLGDVYILRTAITKYAREHEGKFPSDFAHAASYIKAAFEEQVRADQLHPLAPSKQREFPRVNEFELVYQGSLNELANIPAKAVAMIRERQAWPTPSGKWARLYVMVSWDTKVVESDDNFQSWEAEHVIPPRAK